MVLAIFLLVVLQNSFNLQKQPPAAALIKTSSENMQEIYRRTTMPKCDKATLLKSHLSLGVLSPVNLLHIFRTHFPKNTSGRLFLNLFCLTKRSIFTNLTFLLFNRQIDLNNYIVLIYTCSQFFCQFCSISTVTLIVIIDCYCYF